MKDKGFVTPKVSSGIRGFDEISRGGIPKERTTLVSGASGAGKTIFGTQFLYHGAKKHGENGVFVTFEEKPEDIMRNMESFGWNIAKLVKENKWAFVDASPNESDKFEVGKYDLSAFLARIEYAIKKVNAKRIVIDSVSALFPRYEDSAVIRRELYRISVVLKNAGVTTIMTAERPTENGEISRFGVEEFLSDNVVLLHNRLGTYGERDRSLEILKFRGSAHETSEAPLVVGDNAMEIFPKPKPKLQGKSFVKKISTGIKGLDDMLYGGVYKNSTTLLTGGTGTGKTVSALHFIMEGAKRKEKCVLIEFEESKEQLFRNASSFGWNLKKHVDAGEVTLFCQYPEDLKAEQYLRKIQDMLEEVKPDRFVLDSLSALQRIYIPEKFRVFIVGLNALLKMHDCTSFFTHTTSDILGLSQITEAHLSTATDNIIIVKCVEVAGKVKRLQSILKARGSDHEKELKEFEITKKGIKIVGPFAGFEKISDESAKIIKPPVSITQQLG